MTKSIRNILISILGAVFILCVCFCFLSPVIVRADDITTTGISDDNFSFKTGAAISRRIFTEDPTAEEFNLATARTRLYFSFKLDNVDLENLNNEVEHPTTWWGERATNVFLYEFTLYRGNRDGDGTGNLATADPQSSVLVAIFCDSNRKFYGYVAEKNYYTNCSIGSVDGFIRGESISLNEETRYDDIATKGQTFEINHGDYYGAEKAFGKGYTIKQKLELSNNNLYFDQNDGLTVDIRADVNSPFQYYFIRARYCFVKVDGAGMFNTTEQRVYGEIYSSSRSVANVLKRMQDAGEDFNTEFGDHAIYANQILSVENTQRVRIKYLEEIPGTPYATHKYDYVNVPVLQETIYIADVEAQLGKSLRKCLDSNAYCFQKTTDNDGELYQLYYLKNVWLRAMTVDGNFYDYFLDLNKSYKGIYRTYVEAGVLSNDVYEWIFSRQMINKFPALQDYHFDEIYGYFGLVVVPETYTINSALKTMFDVNTSKIGVISTFTFERMLSYEGYQRILGDYDYGFLSKVWSEISGFVQGSEHRATYYVIYSEPGTENALIGEGGQENPDDGSILKEKVAGPVMQIVGDVWEGITGVLGGIAGNFKTILYIALAIVLGIIGFKVYNGLKGNKRSKRK